MRQQCSAGESTCAIVPDGSVVPRTPLSELKAGNVRQEEFLVIWRESPVFLEMRRLAGIRIADVPECKGCEFHARCDGGCRGQAYGFSRRLVSPDHDCTIVHSRKPPDNVIETLN
jgi:radical SAM protein with 4Fe4S-binding SPASM domain